ncbi:hypothetical protein G3A39_42345 [Paraburkholderia aspalathi]|nr:hypothetical protein [Paraburkholderia aspalathi]
MSLPVERLALATESRPTRMSRAEWSGSSTRREVGYVAPLPPAVEVDQSLLSTHYMTLSQVGVVVGLAWCAVAAVIHFAAL